jgi:hypothetical protein
LTGAAKSSLMPLGRYLGNVGITTAVSPRPNKRGKILDRTAEGEASSDFEVASSAFKYVFNWATDLEHFNLNEKYPMPTVESSPWDSLIAGELAFEAYVITAFNTRLPKLSDHISFEPPRRIG